MYIIAITNWFGGNVPVCGGGCAQVCVIRRGAEDVGDEAA